MREVVVRTAKQDPESHERADRLVKLLATGLERLLSKSAQGSAGEVAHVDFCGSLSPNGHAPDDLDDGEHLE